ncbi:MULTISPECIES: purine nucleoside transporter PunC [Aliivibrio]|uniref:Bcr/CflA family efflux transporter n=1 Tax=Aliivibrio fischeri TaxID=668 RepID=A0A6N3Z5N1_ALIFS|nr:MULTISPECIES: purine nucleoside transporter PunC [Aliivibrio]MBD1570618.1 Bcr/CflA family multidrug efflux MFS transporter [Aliivibrio sp. S10_S31]MCE4936533.1 Bcr/CflA family multidrug efflux MFS transporter [Aliivibrio fischeri]MUK44683.1 Bcr/CflA family multidrug efflux MFS transporter [Aliivibrio fischeri]MUK80342.1 Bcr/CflA family multidrug efflux MFS transporter [Aliivibrio fischeri]MUK84649.1 Bcr/CflA family multidrug efflux MFS transporter [Aliivibrio fischeri]
MENKQQSIPYIWLAGLSMLGFLATDMYLPAFDIIRGDLGTTENMIGLTLSIFLLGMAIGQLFYGRLTQKLGTKKSLIIGLSIFAISSLAASFSTSVEMLLVARFFQALGACSANVIWQAMVIQRYDAKTSQRVFATIMPLVALSPALAPLLGAAIEKFYGWSMIFVTLTVIGVGLALRTFVDKEPKQEKSTSTKSITFRDVIKSKKFTGNMLIYAASSAIFFAWLTGSPFVMTQMGYSGADIGLSYVPQTIAFIVGGYGCRWALERFDAQKVLPWILKLSIASVGTVFLVSWRMDVSSIIPMLIPFCFLAAANGAIYPIVVNNALVDFKEGSAVASGLLNFLQMLFCVAASAMVSSISYLGAISMGSIMLLQLVFLFIGAVMVFKVNKEERAALVTQ